MEVAHCCADCINLLCAHMPPHMQSGQTGGNLRQSNFKLYVQKPMNPYLYIISYTLEEKLGIWCECLELYEALKLLIYHIFVLPWMVV